ncbi:SRPBCC family protein [Agrilutibacter solisilvae]|uniref:SRPBCC family protein n=1 Tax=Agrilutibacter solisilvae TaxID=2763317 RepID=A0A974Y0K3_9GAMM|nr:SRPBCC family protein [Lysobacter solisilvae]QSX79063.1 SRPBCC family protein [Lysobacter solisilvae]
MSLAPRATADAHADDYGVLTAPDTVRIERLLPGPVQRVWDYLVQPDLRATWFAGGEFEPRVGGRADLVFHHADLTTPDDRPPPKYAQMRDGFRMENRMTHFDPPHCLGYTFGDRDSHVLFELTPEGDRVRLVVTHTRLSSREQTLSISAGWHIHLDILHARLEGRAPPAFWNRHTALEAEYGARIPG